MSQSIFVRLTPGVLFLWWRCNKKCWKVRSILTFYILRGQQFLHSKGAAVWSFPASSTPQGSLVRLSCDFCPPFPACILFLPMGALLLDHEPWPITIPMELRFGKGNYSTGGLVAKDTKQHWWCMHCLDECIWMFKEPDGVGSHQDYGL